MMILKISIVLSVLFLIVRANLQSDQLAYLNNLFQQQQSILHSLNKIQRISDNVNHNM
jgi:hypothetical protein